MLPVLFLRPPHRVVGKGGGCVNGKKILSVLFGALTSLGIFLLLALVLTWLVTREMLPVGQAPKAVWAALALAALLGALLAEKRVGQMALLTGVATALVFFLVLLSGTALFFGGQYAGLLGNGLSVLAGGLAAGLLGAREKKPRKYRRKNYVSR